MVQMARCWLIAAIIKGTEEKKKKKNTLIITLGFSFSIYIYIFHLIVWNTSLKSRANNQLLLLVPILFFYFLFQICHLKYGSISLTCYSWLFINKLWSFGMKNSWVKEAGEKACVRGEIGWGAVGRKGSTCWFYWSRKTLFKEFVLNVSKQN